MSYSRQGAYKRQLQAARNLRKDVLAELVSEGWSVAAASRQMGISQQAGSKMWIEIRTGLGEPAE